MQESTYLGRTKDGYKVYDRENTHIHFEGMKNQEIIRQGLSFMYANGSTFKKKVVRFKRNIGFSLCVSIEEKDEVIMMYRKGREGKTPIVLNKQPIPCNSLTLIIKKNPETTDSYILITAYVGEESTKEPWDKGIRSEEERAECEKFWATHALGYNPDLIDWERMEQA